MITLQNTYNEYAYSSININGIEDLYVFEKYN